MLRIFPLRESSEVISLRQYRVLTSYRLLLLQRSDIDTSLKDLEGYTAFDLYNSTMSGTKPDAKDVNAELFTWGGVIGRLLGLAVVGFIIALVLVSLFSLFTSSKPAMAALYKCTRQRCRRALRHESVSDFGTFNRSAFVTEKPASRLPDISETSGHAFSPSVSTVGGPGMASFGAAGGGATPPSQVLPGPRCFCRLPRTSQICVRPGPQRRCWWSTRPR